MVRVRDGLEAAQAAAADVDAVELCMQSTDAAATDAARAVRSDFPGVLRLRFDAPQLTEEVVQSAAAAKADEIALPLALTSAAEDARRPPNLRSVAILSASDDGLTAIRDVRGRVDGVMFEADERVRLFDRAGITTLDAFASACRESQLAFGLAGGLEAPDVARLLLLRPDVLAFDAAVRHGHVAEGSLDRHALDAIRALVPRQRGGADATGAVAKVVDRIFVRDFEVPLAIGAYQAEHGARQRVRFSIVAEVVREPGPPRDMRDVFSYDIIIETLRVLSERAHVTFVETLAEEVAAALLAHADVLAVEVKVEKLDVIAGAVGIEIVRRRAPP